MHPLEPVLCLALAHYSIFIDGLFFNEGPVQPPLKGSWMSHNTCNSLTQEYYSCPVSSQLILLSPGCPVDPPGAAEGHSLWCVCTNGPSLGTLLEWWVCNDLRRS